MEHKFLSILRCPDCQRPLASDEKTLTCSACNRELPIVNGIVVFLSLEQLADFFKPEKTGKNLASFSALKEIIESNKKEVMESNNFIDRLKEIVEHGSSTEFQKKYEAETCQWKGDLNNEEAEKANKKTTEVMAEKVHIKNAGTILDWPTGKGCFLRSILGKVNSNTQIICLDIDFVELASLKVFLEDKKRAENVLFVEADARHMPFNNDSFDAVTAWGGFIEVPDSPQAVKESWRVLRPNGWFTGDGDIYKQNSRSMKIADKMGIGSLVTKERIKKCLSNNEFKNIFVETLYKGYDRDELPDEERAPLAARGDWFGLIVAGGQK